MGLVICHETSVTNYQYTLCNIQEEWRSYIYIWIWFKWDD